MSGSFLYTFNDAGVLEEAGSMSESSSPYWWLNSGGQLVIRGGTGSTIEGSTSPESAWRASYSADNPIDTDAGAHPQNIFRLVTRSLWGSVRQEAQFLITGDHFSASPNRNFPMKSSLLWRPVGVVELLRAGSAASIGGKYGSHGPTCQARTTQQGRHDKDEKTWHHRAAGSPSRDARSGGVAMVYTDAGTIPPSL